MNRNEQDIHSLLYQCEQALLTLYNNKLSDNRQQAHQWLLDTQKSQQAWQLCWKLMDKEKAAEVQFFGASMLHFKISRYWLELPEEQYEPLRSEIFKHILAFCGGPKIVLTRLCVALGAFVLHTMPDHWENATSDIIAALHSVTPNQEGVKYNALLELLTVLPEEFMTAELKAGKRMTLRDGLNKAIPHEDFLNIVLDGSSAVLQITQAEITSASSSAQEKLQALRCLNSWVQFGISLFDLDFLLPVLFEAISKTELFDACVDLLVEVISHPTSHKYPNSVWKFAANLAQLHSLLRSSLESSDMDVVCGLCRILVSLGETHTKILLFPDTNERQLISMETVQAILECTNANGWYPVDEQCSEMTLNFWYTLQDDIYSQDAAVQLQLRSAYEPVFNALCQVFLRKVQYPTESEWNGYSSDEKEQFRYYRQDVSDTMMYIYCVTGPLLLQQLHGTLSSLLSGESPPVWQSVEATLYLVQSVSENVEPEEEVFLPAILSLLPKLPSHPKVSQTALVMVGSYSEWLNCHIEQLRSVLPVLLSGLTQEHLASASTQALRGICEECVQDLDQDILQEILSHCQVAAVGKYIRESCASDRILKKVALTGSVIKDRERLRCMECIGYALSVQPHSLVMEKLQNAVGPYLQLLSQIVTPQPSKELKPRLQFTLKIFAVLFKCLVPSSLAPNHSHPAAPVLKEVMTSLKSLNSWIRDNDIAQDVCLCLERAIDTIRDHMGPLVPEIAQLIIDFFSVLPQSCLLDTATMFVGMYGGEVPHMATVALTFQRLSNIVLQLLQTNLQEHPDILQSYMQFAARAIKTNSQLVFGGDGVAAHIFQCGLTAIALSDSHCVRAACNFLVVFINTYETQETTKRILHAYGQLLVGQVITGIGGGVPRQCTDFLAEILLTLNKRCVELLSKWMQAVLEVQGFPSTLVTPAQKQQFTSSVLRGRAQKSRLKEAVKEFSLLCRGLYGFPYTNT